MTGGQRIRFALVLLVLALTAWLGLSESLGAIRSSLTLGQRVATATQLFYGACAVITILAILGRLRFWFVALVLWGVGATITATLAPVVWGGRGVFDALAAGAGCALVVALILWAARTSVFFPSSPASRGQTP